MSDWKKLLDGAGQVSQVATGLTQATGLKQPHDALQTVQALVRGDASGLLSQALRALSGESRLESVRFTFESAEDPEGLWRVLTLHLREALSEPYTCVMELASEQLATDPEALLGAPCVVSICRDARARRLCGIIHRIEHVGIKDNNRLARAHIVPALWVLSQRVDSYIFQQMTVPEILSEVLQEALHPFKRSVRLELTQTYAKREYCVQYRESDLDFILRLMEEEGITYHFDHSGEAEEMVLVDANECAQPLKTMDGRPLAIHGPEADTAEVESVRAFDFSRALHSNRLVVREFDWSRPLQPDLLQAEKEGASAQKVMLERYEHQSPVTLGGYDEADGHYKEDDRSRQSQLRLQAHGAREHQGQGRGNAINMAPGLSFELVGHIKLELDQRYLLTRVEHFGHAPEQLTSHLLSANGAQSPVERYHNRFDCLPARVPFRPERTRSRPRIFGIQTATVVGPEGDAIHTDKHGRIKVRFHWDRVSKGDEHSSCFVRVAQSWAGPQFGAFFLPRVGMEVVVDFIEGDPDRPLVTGCVYNGNNHPPYALPEHQTRSTLKTRSAKQKKEEGQDGFNELRFEDRAGAEEIFIHAQKDFNEVVLHQHHTSVDDDQTNTVHGNQVESVDKDQTLTVHGNRHRTIDRDETVTVHQNRTKTVDQDETRTIHGSRVTTIDQDETVTISGARTETVTGKEAITLQNERTTSVTQNDQLFVGGDRNTQVTGSYDITVGPRYSVTQGKTVLRLSQGDADLTAEKHLYAQNPSGSLLMEKEGGVVKLIAKKKLELVCGTASIALNSDGTIVITGSKEVSVNVQQSCVKLDPPGVTVAGPQITSSAIGIHELTGAVIKIN